jgi:hypothetical protein
MVQEHVLSTFLNQVVIIRRCCVLNHISYVLHSKQIHSNSPVVVVPVIDCTGYRTNIVPEKSDTFVTRQKMSVGQNTCWFCHLTKQHKNTLTRIAFITKVLNTCTCLFFFFFKSQLNFLHRSVKFHECWSRGSRVVPCRWMDRQT